MDDRRQRAIVHLSRLALSAGDLETLLADAARLAAHDLEADHVLLIESSDGGDRVLASAGVSGAEAAARLVDGLSTIGRLAAAREHGMAITIGAEELAALGDDHPLANAPALVVAPAPTGEGRPALMIAVLHRSPDDPGSLAGYLETVGVTAGLAIRRGRDRQRLRDSEERYRRLIEQAPVVTYLRSVGPGARPIYVSPQVEDVLGTPAREFLLRPNLWMQRLHPGDVDAAMAALQAHQETHEPMDIEYRMFHADGSIRWLHDRSQIVESPDDPAMQQGVASDVTALRTAEAEAREREEFLVAMTRASPIVLTSVDRAGNNVYVSEAIEAVTGRAAAEVTGQPALRWLHDEDVRGVATEFASLLAGEVDGAEGSFRYLGPDDDVLHIEYHARPQRGPDGTVTNVIYAMLNVTERLQLAEDLVEARDAAEAASAAKSEFLSRMSHELRTPLNSVLGFAQLLELSDLDADQSEGVRHILDSGRHLLQLVDEVLDIARFDTGRAEVSIEGLAVGEIVDVAIDGCAVLADQHGVSLSRDDDDGWEFHVTADRRRVVQVLEALLENAIVYSDAGDRVRMEVALDDAMAVTIAVVDEGIGFPEDAVADVFTPFERLPDARARRDGAGLGLSLARRLMDAMGGSIGATSAPGVGSRFWITLPRHAPTDAAASPRDENGTQVRGRVLYVEDNPVNVDLIRAALARYPGIELESAGTGREGIDRMRREPPDLLLLDLHLPDLSGEDVFSEARGDPNTAGIPVLVLSADATRATIARLLGNGVRAYLTKPLDFDRLYTLVEELLGPGP